MGQPDIIQKRIEEGFAEREKARYDKVRKLIDLTIAKRYDDTKLVEKDLTSGEIDRNEEVRAVKTLLSQGVVGQIKLKQMDAELHPGELEGVFERVKAFLTRKEITDFKEVFKLISDHRAPSVSQFSDDPSPGGEDRDEFPRAHGQGGDYGRTAKPIEEPSDGFYDSRRQDAPDFKQPASQVSGRNLGAESRGLSSAEARSQTYGRHASIEPYTPADSRKIRRYGDEPSMRKIQQELDKKPNTINPPTPVRKSVFFNSKKREAQQRLE